MIWFGLSMTPHLIHTYYTVFIIFSLPLRHNFTLSLSLSLSGKNSLSLLNFPFFLHFNSIFPSFICPPPFPFSLTYTHTCSSLYFLSMSIVCTCSSKEFLVIARKCGSITRYSLPHLNTENTYNVRSEPFRCQIFLVFIL